MDKVIISAKSNIPEEKLYTEKVIKDLQAENEKLKTDIGIYKGIIDADKEENERLKANKGRCAFKSLDNTFCDEARIKIDKLKLDRDCLNVSLETARKYRGIAETDRDLYKQALQKIRDKLDFHKQELEECLYNPIDAKIREIINSVIGVE